MDFPRFEFGLRTRNQDGTLYIYDPIRKRFFILTPEEWVRQHVLHLLIHTKNIARGRIAVERQIKGTKRRFDILVHHRETGKPELIIECKSYNEPVNQSTFDQTGHYNRSLEVPYLVITNWNKWMAAQISLSEKKFTFLESFPDI